MTSSEVQADKAKKQLQSLLSQREGYVGIGIGGKEQGELMIVVYVERADSPVMEHVPSEREGFVVRTVVTGQPQMR